MGIDRIGPGILRHCAQALCVPLHNLFSFSLCNQCIPPIWKVHKITPVFKSGDKHSFANYRPISLLCSVSKVLERLIYDKIIDFVLPKISVAQFGFLRDRSCLQQLLLFLHNIHKAFDSKSWLDAVYLDISKAFDLVPHMELLYKLRLFGIQVTFGDGFNNICWVDIIVSILTITYLTNFLCSLVCPRVASWVHFLLSYTSTTCLNLLRIH